ncbi:MAG: hypothetical protein QJR08_03630 [Bacillota bacterium]|nr:hypothetical protein [Bacillota bacterium]
MSDHKKWTPGPWRVRPGFSDAHFVVVAGEYADEGEPDLLVHVGTANPQDAHLIAAAPDLYEALDEIVLKYGRYLPMRELSRAKAALAKARGEATAGE